MKRIYTDSFSITRLWDVFADRKFAIPEIQREFVWDSKKACALLDSIYKKLPIGSVLVWETDGHNRALLRHSLHILPAYLKQFRHRRHFGKVMRSHLIPHSKESALWEPQVRRAYRSFQNERLELICKMFRPGAGINLFRKE